jgi:hypothetical protein
MAARLAAGISGGHCAALRRQNSATTRVTMWRTARDNRKLACP